MFEEKGSLTEVPAIKIVLAIFEEELTGILYLKNEDTLKVLYMNRGKLVWAMSNAPEDKLEDILVAKGLLDMDTIESVRTEGSVSSSIGKLLVEKGHLTLEQLVEVTKIQAGRILKSVIDWSQGGYQFVKEPPPERLFNLDINIMNFTFNFVLKEVDMTLVWREIRTVRIHLATTKDSEKIDKYDLSEREQKFLGNFSEGTSIESVLSRYAGSHRDTLLKFVYFFLSSGLLEKLDIEDEVPPEPVAPESQADEIGSIDNLLVDAQPHTSEPTITGVGDDLEIGINEEFSPPLMHGVGIEPLIEEEDIGQINLDEPKEMETESVGLDMIARLPENDEIGGDDEGNRYVMADDQPTMEIGDPADIEEEGLEIPPAVIPDKKKLKQFHYLIILVILILTIGGVIFLVLPEDEIDLGDTGASPGGETRKEPVIDVSERKPVVKKRENARKKDDPVQTSQTPTVGKKDVTPVQKTVTNPPKTSGIPVKKENRTSRPNNREIAPVQQGIDPLKIFRQGDYQKAGELWRQDAVKRGTTYAILLEMDCQRQSVANAFKECRDSHEFYVLNIQRNNKNCYLVLWGQYYSEAEASAAIGRIPAYFNRQQPPARVIELKNYL